jgi:hypothetical protein
MAAIAIEETTKEVENLILNGEEGVVLIEWCLNEEMDVMMRRYLERNHGPYISVQTPHSTLMFALG